MCLLIIIYGLFGCVLILSMHIKFGRDCFFCVSSTMHKNEFVQSINLGFKSGGMFCTLSDGDLGNYLLNKVMDFMGEEDAP